MTDLDDQWQKLIEEHDAARNRYFDAHGPVAKKFGAIGSGESSTNPTKAELDQRQAAWDAWQDVQLRMDEFVKANT